MFILRGVGVNNNVRHDFGVEEKILDVNAVISETSSMLERLIGEDIELVTALKPTAGLIHVDPGQLSQILMNLSINARDAMPDGGKLTIETGNLFVDHNYAINHLGLLPGPYVALSVSDTGVGMTPEVQERIYEPFFTTRASARGQVWGSQQFTGS